LLSQLLHLRAQGVLTLRIEQLIQPLLDAAQAFIQTTYRCDQVAVLCFQPVEPMLDSIESLLDAAEPRLDGLVLGFKVVESLVDRIEVSVNRIKPGQEALFEESTHDALDVGQDHFAVEPSEYGEGHGLAGHRADLTPCRSGGYDHVPSQCYDPSETEAMATSIRAHATEADLLQMPKDGRKYELVNGQIRVSPAGGRHGLIIVEITARLLAFVKQAQLGYVFESSTGFRLPTGNVRSADVSFLAKGRLENERVPDGFIPLPPDLAIEVLSPEDRQRFVLEKVGEYLDAGVPLVWVIDPRARKASVYRSLTNIQTLSESDEFSGEDVVPGFRCRLGEIL